MEDEYLPSFLGERQSWKDVNQTPPSASKIWEKGPAPPANLQCLISYRQSVWWGHRVTPVWTTINSPSPVPSQYLRTVRGNFRFRLWKSQHGSRFDLLHGAGDRPVIPQQMWRSPLGICATQSTHRIIFSLLSPTFTLLPTDDEGHKCLWESTTCRELTRDEGFLGYISVALLSGAGCCILRHYMTVQSVPQ